MILKNEGLIWFVIEIVKRIDEILVGHIYYLFCISIEILIMKLNLALVSKRNKMVENDY